MSLILDALKRAERERQAEPMPASAPPDVVAMPGRAPAAPRPGVRLVSVFVFGGGLALAGLLLWDAFRTPPPPAPAPVAAAPTPQPAPPVIKASPAPPPAVVPGTEAVASLDDLSDDPELEAAPPAPAPAPARKQKPVSPKDIATRPAPPPATAAPVPLQPAPAAPPQAQPQEQPQEQAPPPPQAVTPPAPQPAPQQQAAPAGIPPVLTQPAPLRKFREMPPDYRADFPPLRVEIHVYEKQVQRRFVMVNGRKYREGERMAEGPALIEIVPEGMVLEFRGEKVLYTLGR